MTSYTQPRNVALKDGEYVKGPGKIIYFDQSADRALLGTSAKFALGVSAGEGSRGEDNAYEATGGTVAFYPLGGVLMIQALNGETWKTGELAYAGANGLVTKTAGSDKKVGIYVGPTMSTATPALVDANEAGDTGATQGMMIAIATNSAEIGENA